jgi:hypothetical protein
MNAHRNRDEQDEYGPRTRGGLGEVMQAESPRRFAGHRGTALAQDVSHPGSQVLAYTFLATFAQLRQDERAVLELTEATYEVGMHRLWIASQ